MNLEALALRRAEEQDGDATWKRPDPGEKPLLSVVRARGYCVCGRCKRCKDRKYMRAWRDGRFGPRRVTCKNCGRARNTLVLSGGGNPLGWCSRCSRNEKGAEFRRAMRESFWEGGGI